VSAHCAVRKAFEVTQRWFPIQRGGKVDWTAAEQAYRDYSKRYGTDQSLERLAERGGFGIVEFCEHYRGQRLNPLERSSNDEVCRVVLTIADELGLRWKRK
jgi:hypothetical protein